MDVFGVIVEFMTPDDDDKMCVMRATMPPGVTVPLHSHNDFEDFYILAGSYQVLVEGEDGAEWRDYHAGDYVRVPGDIPHAVRNVTEDAAVDLIVTTARMGNFFREVGRPVGSPPPSAQDMVTFVAAASRYGYWLASPEENAAVGIAASILTA
ncbi:cupin domain-containing protein [Mycobacterium marseillense]|uniref:cupin domain-containing protein n=1 Tax=Mycobacterium marseillense TaxID=701042 RepID=UPI001F4F2ADB|nr:cupin domain-containing protein [Mycobacterium marseillense]